MTYREAASHCCDYGLVLASVETQDELQCLKSSIIGDEFLPAHVWHNLTQKPFEWLGGVPRPVHLWTSGTRKGTVNGFRWCSSKAPLNISHFRTDDSIGGNLYSLMTICCPDQTFYLSPYFYLDPEVGKTRLAFCEEQQWWFKFCSNYGRIFFLKFLSTRIIAQYSILITYHMISFNLAICHCGREIQICSLLCHFQRVNPICAIHLIFCLILICLPVVFLCNYYKSAICSWRCWENKRLYLRSSPKYLVVYIYIYCWSHPK